MTSFNVLLTKAIQESRKNGISSKIPLEGCNIRDIEEVMEAQSIFYLPEIYKDFLLIVGKSSGGWFLGSDVSIRFLRGVKESFKEELEWNNAWDDNYKNIFIFMGHQGYVFYFFYTNKKEIDPIVYRYMEGVVKSCEIQLSEFLLHQKFC